MASVLRFAVTVATTIFGLLLVTFFIGRVIPIDPVLAIVGDRAPAHLYERTRIELGLNLPLYEQFWIYTKQALSGNFGTSVLTTNPVI
jgi:peptide/nickel transport system permease protein